MPGDALSIGSGRLSLLRRPRDERVLRGIQTSAQPRHLERDQGAIAERAEDPIDSSLSDGLEEVPNVHLHQPATTGMTLRGADKVSTGRERKARRVRFDRVQDVLSDPTLRPHQRRIRYANRTITTRRSPALSGARTLLQSKDTVRIYSTVDYLSQRLRCYVDQVAEVGERQDDR